MGHSSRCTSCKKKKDDCKCSHKYLENQREETTCFIDSHDFRSTVTQPCNGSTTVVFEDLTNNHNITRIEASTFTTPPCTAILIIETRDGCPPIERVLSTGENLSIEVEDLRRVSVRCEGNPTGFCNVTVTGSKTFCICCPKDAVLHSCSSCNQRKETCNCKEEQKIETTCFIDSHSPLTSFYNLPCGTSIVAFEDLTNNHNKMMIQGFNNDSSPCTTILIIETRNGCPPIERILPLVPNQFNIEVEDVKKVSIRCQGNSTGTCSVTFNIQKTFCICCPKDPDSHYCFNC
ncbi:hypothetical protein C8K15_101452 [Paenisporosarcina sp. OV554]|nr:hypothetical protein C8K15_101452 [Paenisporosarcina sp. OV554]